MTLSFCLSRRKITLYNETYLRRNYVHRHQQAGGSSDLRCMVRCWHLVHQGRRPRRQAAEESDHPPPRSGEVVVTC